MRKPMNTIAKGALMSISLLLFWPLFDCARDGVSSFSPGKSIPSANPWVYLEKDGVYMLTVPAVFATDEQSVNTLVWDHMLGLVSSQPHAEVRQAMFKAGKLKKLEKGTRFRILVLRSQTFHGSVLIKELDSEHTFYFSPWEYLQPDRRFVFPFERIR